MTEPMNLTELKPMHDAAPAELAERPVDFVLPCDILTTMVPGVLVGGVLFLETESPLDSLEVEASFDPDFDDEDEDDEDEDEDDEALDDEEEEDEFDDDDEDDEDDFDEFDDEDDDD